jgi:hypothetical protein
MMRDSDRFQVPELDLPKRPRARIVDLPSAPELAIELAVQPGTSRDSRPSPLRYCAVCGQAIERYAAECHVCGAPSEMVDAAAPTGAHVEPPKTALERAIDPLTGRWAPLPSERPLLPPSSASRAPARGFWDTMALAPMGLWLRIAIYSFVALVVCFILFPCRMHGSWVLGILVCIALGVVGAINRARADAEVRAGRPTL